MARKTNEDPNKLAPHLEYCWVNDSKKICYATEEEAISAARLAENDHGLPYFALKAYRCPHGDHYHLAKS